MKVYVIADEIRPDIGRGVPRYTYELITNLIKITKGLLDIHIIRYKNLPWDFHFILANILVRPMLATPLSLIKANIYHAVYPSLLQPLIIAQKRPLVVTVHDTFGEYGNIFRLKHKIIKYYFKRCDKIITIAKFWKDDLIYNSGVNEDKIVVILNGVDNRRFKPMKTPEEKSEQIVLYIGGLERAKGLGVLLRAFRIVISRVNKVKLLIGGKGPHEQYFKDLVSKLNIGRFVKFLGFVPEEELPLYYSLADVFVYPTFLGLGLMTLEAMACGTPVISTNTCDIPEYLADAAILVQPGSIKELADAIISVLTDGNLRKKLIKKGLERARVLTWEETARRTLEIYKELCDT